jgi:hypothetical protein
MSERRANHLATILPFLPTSLPNFDWIESIVGCKTVARPVETTQVAPTILAALGLDPNSLQSVQIEGTQVLPGLGLDSGKSR